MRGSQSNLNVNGGSAVAPGYRTTGRRVDDLCMVPFIASFHIILHQETEIVSFNQCLAFKLIFGRFKRYFFSVRGIGSVVGLFKSVGKVWMMFMPNGNSKTTGRR